jgi:hypothetical protein
MVTARQRFYAPDRGTAAARNHQRLHQIAFFHFDHRHAILRQLFEVGFAQVAQVTVEQAFGNAFCRHQAFFAVNQARHLLCQHVLGARRFTAVFVFFFQALISAMSIKVKNFRKR